MCWGCGVCGANVFSTRERVQAPELMQLDEHCTWSGKTQHLTLALLPQAVWPSVCYFVTGLQWSHLESRGWRGGLLCDLETSLLAASISSSSFHLHVGEAVKDFWLLNAGDNVARNSLEGAEGKLKTAIKNPLLFPGLDSFGGAEGYDCI